MHYRHLTQHERYQIGAQLAVGKPLTELAQQMGRHQSTLSRELKRNQIFLHYHADAADHLARARRQISAANARRASDAAWQYAREKLRETWSPEHIAGYPRAHRLPRLSHETIDQRIYADKRAGGDLHLALRHHKRRRKRRGTIQRQRRIEERPEVANQRKRYGDWEADLVLGARHSEALVTINERKSRFALVTRVATKHAAVVRDAIVRKLVPYAKLAHTLTTGNGKEFALHEEIAARLKLAYYFCHPHAAWERGANENRNGLLRQFFPKHRKLSEVTDAEIALAEHRLNHRPRKCLGFKTPHQVFMQQVKSNHAVALRT
jgi:IS30 family transposase